MLVTSHIRTLVADMERLPNPPLVPSSMSAGGEWHSNDLAMTAPGSQPITALPVGLDESLPLPVNSGPQVPVNPQRDRVTGNAAPGGGDGGWMTFGDDGGSPWRQM